MAWIRPTIEHLKLVLAQDEIVKLEQASADLADRIQQQLDAVADLYRAAYRQKGYWIDGRDHYIDNGYLIPMLNYARYQIWTTFPMADNYALSKPREDLYKSAEELLKNPYLATSKPDEGGGVDPGDNPISHLSADAAITIPWLRIEPEYGKFGFPEAYWVEKKPIL